ncbi:ABC transporter substrate-binding protein [Sphaerospermopsis sp. FACHB-1194]|uniref:ABC transporter substrate-binding protein n=1 Tax=Sphaerospermopsis sp. FACHB-1194 TaxID=2692862 RepID=UPI0016816080|nr:ABC transporter substrate-binding protein [Sphaerospermopsis sp. FACHB-1194]MBD2148194.1 amino acid ABC transporter substrate-binding protein [Sphaerospermopsis sp. FACHB-1194]
MKKIRKNFRQYTIRAKITFLILILSFTVWGYWIIHPQDNLFIGLYNYYFYNTWCNNFKLSDNLSCGEESLFTQEKFSYFHAGNWQKAVNYFTQKRNTDPNNPEILIYLNNAKLMQQEKITSEKSYTIAVAVPINGNSEGIAKALLRGAAQVQEEFNKNPKYPGLKIIIVNDKNNPNTVNKLAEDILSKKDIVAVIGHYASELTKAALPVYHKHQIVFISPASTALRSDILAGNTYPDNFFFRTVNSVKVQTTLLIKKWQLAKLAKEEKVAIFYTPSSTYSKSALEEFRKQLDANKIIAIDISQPNFIPNKILNEVKKQRAKALILIPDGHVNSLSFKNTLSIIDVNENQLPMGGLWVLYDPQILNRRNLVKNLLIFIPWHSLTAPNQEVITKAQNLWGTGKIDAQTAMSHDATLVLTKALEKLNINDSLQKQRLDIQQHLRSLQVIGGASGTISFDQDGDRKENISQIVRVVPTQCSTYGAMFVPINYNVSDLKCLDQEASQF